MFSSAPWSVVMALSISTLVFATSSDVQDEALAPLSLQGLEYPADAVRARGKGLDRGSFEVFQLAPLPVAWVWTPDATADGVGSEYWVVHPNYVAPGPGAPVVDDTIVYLSEVNHTTFADFLLWIVATYPHVSDPADVQVYRKDAGPIGP